jgi:hypothetical protein
MPIVIGSYCLGIVFTSLGFIGYLRHEDKPGLVRSIHKYSAKLSFLSRKEPAQELELLNGLGAKRVEINIDGPHPRSRGCLLEK